MTLLHDRQDAGALIRERWWEGFWAGFTTLAVLDLLVSLWLALR